MKRLIFMIMLILVTAHTVTAAPLRVFVGEFNAVGAQAGSDAKAALQTLMASRLTNDKVLAVSSAAEAEVLVNGTYLAIGKQYNLDAVAKTAGGQTVTRSFVQGEGGQEALFGAVGSLADKLSADLLKRLEAGQIPRLAVAAPTAVQTAVAVPQPRPQGSDIVRPGTPAQSGDLQRAPQGDIIRPQAFYRGSPNRGEIKRLDGMFNLLAPGGVDADGKRLLFMAQDRTVQLIREGENRPLAGFGLGPNDKILSIDYVDATGSGKPDLYVTVVKGGEVASQVWELQNKRLVKVADDISYFFRAIALAGGPLKLYAQEQGRKADRYFGDVYEVARQGKKLLKNQNSDASLRQCV